ncbi:MAG: lipopolysaccharide kinase InaA family protein [Planctomycetia bacterium]
MGDRLLIDPALAPALHAAGVGTAAQLLALGGDGEAAHVVRMVDLPVAGTVGRFHLKRYAYPTWARSRGLLGRGTLLGSAPCLNEFRRLAEMREHQVPAVRPVVAAARTRGGRLVAHALLTEHVPGTRDLQQRLQDPGDPLCRDRRLRRQVAVMLGSVLHRMHAAALVHRDLYPRNILLRVDPEGLHEPRLWLCDCRRAGAPSWRRGTWHDLATLDADWRGRMPRGDRLATLRAYLADDADLGEAVRRVARLRPGVRLRPWA